MLLLALIGILFLVVAWFVVASPMLEKTDVLKEENATLAKTVALYEEVAQNTEEYQERIAECEEIKKGIIVKYPVYITREDEVMLWANMENTLSNRLALTSLNLSDWQEVLPATQQTTQETPQETQDETLLEETANTESSESTSDAETMQQMTSSIHLYKTPMNYGFESTYNGLKDMLNYLMMEGNRKSIENISVSFDATTGNLIGNMDVSLYFLMGVDKQYQALQIPFVQKGVPDVFHTVGNEPVQPEENEETQAEESPETE